MAKEIYKVTQNQKRKTVHKKDLGKLCNHVYVVVRVRLNNFFLLETVVEMLDEYSFLEGTID